MDSWETYSSWYIIGTIAYSLLEFFFAASDELDILVLLDVIIRQLSQLLQGLFVDGHMNNVIISRELFHALLHLTWSR